MGIRVPIVERTHARPPKQPSLVVVLYLMKYATDVLLMAPAAVSVIFGVSRVLDAVTDPLAGYFSDRTQSRHGRRRPWLLGAALPLGLAFLMIWAAPLALKGAGLVAWMAVAVVTFYAVMTLVNVPHQSWGAELSEDYHERTRIFGRRHLMTNVGTVTAVLCLFFITRSDEPRDLVLLLTAIFSVFTVVTIVAAALTLRERTEFQGRGPQAVLGVYRDLARNPHARLIMVVFFIESLGGATIGVLTPYMAQYVILHISFPLVVLTYMIASTVTVPLWTALFGCFFFVGEGDVAVSYVLAFILGAAGGCGNVIAPSVTSDVVDWDELETGERKEGGYFAAFSFMQKSAAGITIMITGFALQLSGYVPNAPQGEAVQLTIRSLYALFPLSCYCIGALLFMRFSLNEEAHAVVKAALAERRTPG
ncbi:MAG: MFS transporter [Gammaproteobacteria bacterium]|nr:MFS transporter [Gammaproteobacteria bacterium]